MTTCTVGDYLLDRLKELGIRHLFGVPGDYVLGFNAQIEARSDVAWVANCNELNAAYAAEGYARANGVGAFVVTAGVGDLGAAGGVGGALAEHSSVVVISGVPGVSRPGATHHTAGDGDFSRFQRIYAEITLANTTAHGEQRRGRDRPGAARPAWWSMARSSSPCPPTWRPRSSLRRSGRWTLTPPRPPTSRG